MADTGWIYGANGRTIAGIYLDWTNPSEVAGAADSVSAYSDLGLDGVTDYLNAYTYNAGIPAGATINGIYVAIARHAAATYRIRDMSVYCMDDTSTKGDNKNSGTWYPSSSTWEYYGGAADLWGASWTAAQINAGTFGMGLRSYDTTAACRVYCDTIGVKVYYTAAPPGADHLMIMGM